MDPLLIGILVCLIALLFLFSGMPIAFALGITSVVMAFLFGIPDQFDFIANIFFDSLDSFGLLAIPLFIFMGVTIAFSPAGNDLYEALHRWLYRIPGGLAISNIIACAIFAAMCGSSPATAAAIGTSGIPQMMKRGYPPSLASGAIVGGGTLGILIPPSVTMIVYGIATETSIGKLFMAGIIPGIMLVVMFSLWAVYAAHRHRGLAAAKESEASGAQEQEVIYYSLKQKVAYLPKTLPFIIIITIIMYALYGGLATPSEAAAVGALASLILVTLIYKMFSFKVHKQILGATIKETTMILLLLAGSFLFGSTLTKLHVTQSVTEMIVNLEVSRWVLLLVINGFLLVLGCFLPPVAIILIVAPILHPIITGLDFDPIWFGVIMTLNMEAGLITPPMGINLYVVQGIAPEIPLSSILKGSMPFMMMTLLGIVALCFFPQLALWLPSMMIGQN
ncbi:MAG: TRAP transporter large permease [Desulfarculaceae bacterium]|jgi:tripartite ATP-independent transporter DctM subunit